MYYLTALFYLIWNDNSFALKVTDCVELRLPPFLHPMMYQSVPTVWTPRPSPEIAAINILDDLPIVSIQGFVETHRGCSTINKKTWCISYLAMFVLKNNDKDLYFLLLHHLNLEKVLHFEKKKVWAPSDFVSTNKAGKGLDPTPSIYIYNEFCWFASFINIIFDFSVRIVCGSC